MNAALFPPSVLFYCAMRSESSPSDHRCQFSTNLQDIRDWVVGMSGQDDYELQAGDVMEVWVGTRWLFMRLGSSSDSWRRLWRFLDKSGTMVIPHLGMRVQL